MQRRMAGWDILVVAALPCSAVVWAILVLNCREKRGRILMISIFASFNRLDIIELKDNA